MADLLLSVENEPDVQERFLRAGGVYLLVRSGAWCSVVDAEAFRAGYLAGEAQMMGRTPTAEEQRWMDAVADMGCIVCLMTESEYTPAEVHHLDGSRKHGCHLKTIGLCIRHHRMPDNGKAPRWVSRHGDGRKAFEARYGSEADLLIETRQRLLSGESYFQLREGMSVSEIMVAGPALAKASLLALEAHNARVEAELARRRNGEDHLSVNDASRLRLEHRAGFEQRVASIQYVLNTGRSPMERASV